MSDSRALVRAALHRLQATEPDSMDGAAGAIFAADVVAHVAAPIGDLVGRDELVARWLRPLAQALPGGLRRDDIVIGGRSRTRTGRWVACLGHRVGNFAAPLAGIAPSGKLVFLRCGEFYRLDGDRIVEAYILPDLIDLIRQAGRMPLPAMLGTEVMFPAPATQDGVLPDAADRSEASVALVEAMLGDLGTFDPDTFESRGQSGAGGYWHPQMLWYGPAGIGSNFTYEGFQRDHRIPFLTAFPDRKGGNHFARFGDGDYVCSGGWPSMGMTHLGPYLGVAPTGRRLSLRVMDFWRCESSSIRENWVLLDFVDLFGQMGVDLLARAAPPRGSH